MNPGIIKVIQLFHELFEKNVFFFHPMSRKKSEFNIILLPLFLNNYLHFI